MTDSKLATDGDDGDWPVDISPDGTRVLFHRKSPRGKDKAVGDESPDLPPGDGIGIVSLSGENLLEWPDLPGHAFPVAWSPCL